MIKSDQYINKVIFSEYLIQKKIGKGSFGVVYQGVVVSTNQKIAAKLEKRVKDDSGLLETEACRLYLMQGEGIPKIICYGNNQTHNILIQELLGKSLEELFNINGRKFSLKTVCSIGIEMIKRIKFVHSKFHIHRDIKPDNFMTGRDKNDNKIYLIDFGLAKKYYSFTKKQHIKFHTGKNLIGTARYCGRNAHKGYEQGRRDDIESIGYVLMYFLNGVLPWQGIKVKKGEDQFEKIAEKKYHTSFEELTKGHPEEFLLYFKHCDSLNFEDEPNYDYLISLFKSVINKYCFDCLYDYDWKKNTIPNLSAIKTKYEDNNNNNKDISLLVHNNVSAIESKGDGKEEDKDNNIKNIKLKKEVFIGEDNNNHVFQNENKLDKKVLKKNKSTNLLIRKSIINENLDIHNKGIGINEKSLNDMKNNNKNIFIVNNSITPRIQNININISFNNNLNDMINKEDNIFNKNDININHKLKKDIYDNLYNNNINQLNNIQVESKNKNYFHKKNIKKEYFFSYDLNMDNMVKSTKNSIKKVNINYEKENIISKKIKKEKTNRFQKPKQLENIFTEEDLRSEDIIGNNFNNPKNTKESNNILKKNTHNSQKNFNISFNNESFNKNHKLKKEFNISRINDHKDTYNKIDISLTDNIINEKEFKKEKGNKLKRSISCIDINKSGNYKEKEILQVEKNKFKEKEENNESQKKKRNRVKSVDNKIKREHLGCYCCIF